jgi:hypothetical protein
MSSMTGADSNNVETTRTDGSPPSPEARPVESPRRGDNVISVGDFDALEGQQPGMPAAVDIDPDDVIDIS